jgi:hypothetical protein
MVIFMAILIALGFAALLYFGVRIARQLPLPAQISREFRFQLTVCPNKIQIGEAQGKDAQSAT